MTGFKNRTQLDNTARNDSILVKREVREPLAGEHVKYGTRNDTKVEGKHRSQMFEYDHPVLYKMGRRKHVRLLSLISFNINLYTLILFYFDIL